MDLRFDPDLIALSVEFGRTVSTELAVKGARARLEEGNFSRGYDIPMWSQLRELSWTGLITPEELGGSGLGVEAGCLLAEEAGRHLLPAPFVLSALQVQAILLRHVESSPKASDAISRIANGSAIATLIAPGATEAVTVLGDGDCVKITGSINAARLAMGADFGLLCVRADRARLLLVPLADTASIKREASRSIDLVQPCGILTFDQTDAFELVPSELASSAIAEALARAAIIGAYEQIGGAQAALDLASTHARQRYAFGRPIGSFQAIKHLLADMLVRIDSARSCAVYGLCSFELSGDNLVEAASVAHLAATDAYRFAARGVTQVHGAIGITWEHDCHLHYRRAQALGSALLPMQEWRDTLVTIIDRKADNPDWRVQ